MNNRLTIQDLAVLLADYTEKDKESTERFLKEFISVVTEGVCADELVKVKGIGTFKKVPVGERESIHVNTGERFVIPAHYKFSFLPDKELREQVNKPFSFFETTELSDRVDFTDVDSAIDEELIRENEDESIEEEIPEEIIIEKENVEVDSVETEKEKEKTVEIQKAETCQEESETPPPAVPTDESETTVEPIEMSVEETTIESVSESSVEDSPVSDCTCFCRRRNIVFLFILVLILFNGTLYLCRNYFFGITEKPETCSSQLAVVDTMANVTSSQVGQVFTDSLDQLRKKERDSVQADQLKHSEKKSVDQPIQTEPKKKIEPQNVELKKENKVENKHPQVLARVKIEPGSRLTLIALKYYGHKLFWVYLFEYNKRIIHNPNNVPIGTVIEVPSPEIYGINRRDRSSLEKAAALQTEILNGR